MPLLPPAADSPDPGAPLRPVQGEAAMLARAAELSLPIPAACRPGVVANLDLLAQHARVLLEGSLP